MEAEQYLERIQAAVQTVFQRMQPEMVESMQTHGITPTQFFVLIYVKKQGGCKVSQLADHMDVKPSAVTLMVDRLEQNELVRREHDTKDRRVVNIRLTEHGEQKLQEVVEARRTIVRRYLSLLTEDELAVMANITEKLAAIAVSDI